MNIHSVDHTIRCVIAASAVATLAAAPLQTRAAEPKLFTLELQRRDPQTGAPSSMRVHVDPRTVGIVVVDMWNWHWCKTSTMRVGALVPRMNRVLAAARSAGMQVFLCPTDVADNYVGTPMVESLVAVPRLVAPHVKDVQCPPAPDGGGCTCGAQRCAGNYGWDGMHPDLVIGERDLMPNDQETLYSLCRQLGITRLIYMGVHTQVCLLGKSIGLRAMTEAGLDCVLARDLTDAHGRYDPAAGITPDQFTSDVIAHFEKHLAPTVNMAEALASNGRWEPSWRVDPVRIAPWGTRMRPHVFDGEIRVTLSAPGHSGAEIRYTLDGADVAASSPLYTEPLKVRSTTLVKTAAFENGRSVCLPSEGYFAQLGPKPPLPQVHLSVLKPVRAVGPGHSPSSQDHRFSPGANPPQMDLTNRKQPLRLRGQRYAKGIGVQAPNQLIYEIERGWQRFVALAGVDEYILDTNHGSNLAMHPSVVFKVFLDGVLAAESPVMRISEEPWRFDVPIPDGARRISLVATDAGDGSREDLANWVNAGFVTR